MNELVTMLLALVIAVYGLLFIVGGQRQANRWPQWLWRRSKLIIRSTFRLVRNALHSVVVSGLRFVLCRPRR